MTDSTSQAKEPTIRIKPLRVLRSLGNFAGFGVGVVGLFANEVDILTRFVLAGVALLFAVAGACASKRIERSAASNQVDKDAVEKELAKLQGAFSHIGANGVMRALARPLFDGNSGWRLSVYVLVESENEWWLQRKCRVSSSPRWENSGRQRFAQRHSFLRDMEQADLSSQDKVYASQSGEFPDPEKTLGEWMRLQQKILGDRDTVRALAMRPRKYAWCAVREEDGDRRVVALIAESTEPNGIAFGVIQSETMAPLLTMLARMAEMPASMESAIQRSALELWGP